MAARLLEDLHWTAFMPDDGYRQFRQPDAPETLHEFLMWELDQHYRPHITWEVGRA